MTKREPLATVVDNGQHPAGPDFEEWLLLGGKRGTEDNWLESLAADINAAVEAREAPLLALLAEALKHLAQTGRHHPACTVLPCSCGYVDLMNRIDAAGPGEWVPKAKLDDAMRVIGDLQQELGKPAQSPLSADPSPRLPAIHRHFTGDE